MVKPGDVENGVLIGLDGHLFLAGGAHNVMDTASGNRAISAESLANFQRNLEARGDWARSNGADYLHVIFPDKQSILPESWPLAMPMQLAQKYLKAAGGISQNVLYPSDALQRQSSLATIKTDTHLSDYGYFLVACCVVTRMQGLENHSLIKILADKFEVSVETEGDLAQYVTGAPARKA